MNKSNFYLLVFLALTITLGSCKKDNNHTDNAELSWNSSPLHEKLSGTWFINSHLSKDTYTVHHERDIITYFMDSAIAKLHFTDNYVGSNSFELAGAKSYALPGIETNKFYLYNDEQVSFDNALEIKSDLIQSDSLIIKNWNGHFLSHLSRIPTPKPESMQFTWELNIDTSFQYMDNFFIKTYINGNSIGSVENLENNRHNYSGAIDLNTSYVNSELVLEFNQNGNSIRGKTMTYTLILKNGQGEVINNADFKTRCIGGGCGSFPLFTGNSIDVKFEQH